MQVSSSSKTSSRTSVQDSMCRRSGRRSGRRASCGLAVERCVVFDLALEHIAVDGRQDFINQAVGGATDELPGMRILPRPDVERLGQLTVTRDGRALELEPINRAEFRTLCR